MARPQRIDLAGYYHVINRGVEQREVYLDDEDFEKFLEIIKAYKPLYEFKLEAYCLMNNHYHLLISTCKENISLIMKQINYNYTRYFNYKYKRVGHLWQGRFKSYYIYDETYLDTVIRYIEYNPIKANLTKQIGEYKWSSKLSLETPFSREDEENIKTFESTTLTKDRSFVQKHTLSLAKHLHVEKDRAVCIQNALKDGYKQTEIAKYLGLSDVSISKILKIHREKVKLFEKLRDKGIFWSYCKIWIMKKPEKLW